MTRKANIVFVLPAGLTLSGVTVWSIELCRQLVKIEHSVGLIQHKDVPPVLNIQPINAVRYIYCKNQSPTSDFYTETDLPDFLADYKDFIPAVIIPNGETAPYATCALLSHHAKNLRIIGFAHADEDKYYDWLSYYEPIIHKFVAVSTEIALNLQQLIPHRKEDILVKPYAVGVAPELNHQYSLKPNPLKLLFAGRLIERQKRVSDLVRLVKLLLNDNVNFQLNIVGDGPDKGKFEDSIQTLGLEAKRRVSFMGNVSPTRISSIWQSADICILVSEFEGTSVSMLEAMAAGCVPVVTRVSGTKRVIQFGVNGFTFPIGDIAEMARIIKTLDIDRASLTKIGQAAHATILDGYSYDQYVPWFLALVDEVWQQPPRRWPEDRPIHRYPTLKERMVGLSGEELSQLLPTQKLIKALGFKLAAHPALGWLYRFRRLGKKIVGD